MTKIHSSLTAALLLLGSLLLMDSTYIHAKALLAQILIEHAWQRTHSAGDEVTPWSWADTWPVARLRVENHDLDLYVLSGATGAPLAFGPGHYAGTALPGSAGTSVIAGHRDTHFRFMQAVGIGDELLIENRQKQTIRYRVIEREIFDSSREMLTINKDEDLLKLVTCYPFDAVAPGGSLRFVITARPVQFSSVKTTPS